MYLYSSDRNKLRITLSKADAELFILTEPSQNIRKYILTAIIKAALPKSNFLPRTGKISARLIESPKGRIFLEFTNKNEEQISQQLKCYLCANLKEVAELLKQLKVKSAKVSRLYSNSNKYYLLSEKDLNGNIFCRSDCIQGVLEEYADLVSQNALKEIYKLL